MKKIILFLFVGLLFSINVVGQINKENAPVIKYVDSVIGKHVTFVSWYTEKDTIKVTQFRIWDFEKKIYLDYYEDDIKRMYPILFRGFTIKVDLPLSSTNWSYIINLNFIHTVYFLNRTYFMDSVPHFRRKDTPWEIFT
jgi:hypothetical protein